MIVRTWKRTCVKVTERWLSSEVKELLDELSDRRLGDGDRQGGAYTGISGIAYAFLRAARVFPDHQQAYMDYCRKLISKQLKTAMVCSFNSLQLDFNCYFCLCTSVVLLEVLQSFELK